MINGASRIGLIYLNTTMVLSIVDLIRASLKIHILLNLSMFKHQRLRGHRNNCK